MTRGNLARPDFDTARRLVHEFAPASPTVATSLVQSVGQACAAPVYARDDHPRFDAAAMDGYALPDRDWSHETFPLDLALGAPIAAGRGSGDQAMASPRAISTGARVPANCQAILVREEAIVVATPDGPRLRLSSPPLAGSHIRRRGEDIRAGDLLAPTGAVVSAETVGALACGGVETVPVRRRPAFALIGAGDELTAPGARPRDDQIHDANGPMIAAMIDRAGLGLRDWARVPDDPPALREAVRKAMDDDAVQIVVSTGGVSAGDHDYLPAVLARIGAEVHFHGVRMRPGKPVLFATLANGKPFFALPGNPVAAAVGFRFFVLGWVRAALGAPFEVGEAITGDHGRRETTQILKAWSVEGGASPPRIAPASEQRSHMMGVMARANTWLVVPPLASRDEPARWFPMSAPLNG